MFHGIKFIKRRGETWSKARLNLITECVSNHPYYLMAADQLWPLLSSQAASQRHDRSYGSHVLTLIDSSIRGEACTFHGNIIKRDKNSQGSPPSAKRQLNRGGFLWLLVYNNVVIQINCPSSLLKLAIEYLIQFPSYRSIFPNTNC